MHAAGLFTHSGPEVLQAIELPEVYAGPAEVRIRVHAARSTRLTLFAGTAAAPNSKGLIRRPMCREWRRRGSSMKLEAAFPRDARLATSSWQSLCRRAPMMLISAFH